MSQTCPRRMSDMGPWPREEGLDDWETGHGLYGVQNDTLSCNFCGSLHPDVFMDWLEQGAEITPTDKSYKCYVRAPTDNPRYGEVAEGLTESGSVITSVYGREAKFYLQHLSMTQRQQFVKLLNDGRLNLGYPGYFYQMPYFVRLADPDEA